MLGLRLMRRGAMPRAPLAALPRVPLATAPRLARPGAAGLARPLVTGALGRCAVRSRPPALVLRRGFSIEAGTRSQFASFLTEMRTTWAGEILERRLGRIFAPVFKWVLSPLFNRVLLPFYRSTIGNALYYVRLLFQKYPALHAVYIGAMLLFTGSIVLRAAQKMQHTVTGFLRKLTGYFVEFSIIWGLGVVYLIIAARHRLSMRSVHRDAFQRITKLTQVQQKLGKPITMVGDKRIEMRTGGYFKLKWDPGKSETAQKAVNAAEKLTGQDIDGDGDVGEAGSSSRAQAARKKLDGVFGYLKMLANRWHVPYPKYKRQRAHMVFPIEGPHGEQAMVSAECVKRPGDWSTPLGYNDFKLLAVDFVDNSWWLERGDEDRYNEVLIKELRDPMKEWMMMMALMDEEDELDDAVDGMLKDRRRLKSDDLI